MIYRWCFKCRAYTDRWTFVEPQYAEWTEIESPIVRRALIQKGYFYHDTCETPFEYKDSDRIGPGDSAPSGD